MKLFFRFDKYFLRLNFILIALSFCASEVLAQYSYNPQGKTDPFMPEEIELNKISTSLEFKPFEATKVKLIGTVMGAEPTALVQLPEDKNAVILGIGARVGNNAGRVIAISKHEITIREITAGVGNGGKGGKSFRDTVVKFDYDSKRSTEKSITESNSSEKNKIQTEFRDKLQKQEKEQKMLQEVWDQKYQNR